jgi:glycosyltransferase involved in cell wall biosynthesis
LKQRILIAIPTFNCEKQIPRVLQELLQEWTLWNEHEVELLIIDNRSTDHSVHAAKDVLKTAAATCKTNLIRNQHNLGLGGSQKQAFAWAMKHKLDFLVVLHGDHQATPREIQRLLTVAINRPAHAAILGSRFSVGSVRTGYSKIRTLGNGALNLAYSVFSFRRVEDLGSGLNLFRLSAFDLRKVMGYSNGFTFNMDLLLDMIQTKKLFQYCPITWTELDQVSNARNFKVGWSALKTLLQWRFGDREPQENLLGFSYELVLGQDK